MKFCYIKDQCLAHLSSEKLLFAADGNNKKIHNQTFCRETLGGVSFKLNVSAKLLPLGLRELQGRGSGYSVLYECIMISSIVLYAIPECVNKQVSICCTSYWALFFLSVLSNSDVLFFAPSYYIILIYYILLCYLL